MDRHQPAGPVRHPFWRAIGARVRQMRRRRGLSVDRLAEHVGVVRQQIVRLEAGTGGTTLPRLKHIADVLEVSLGDLLQDVDTTASAPAPTGRDDLVVALYHRGLSDAEIEKVLDYIDLLERARLADALSR